MENELAFNMFKAQVMLTGDAPKNPVDAAFFHFRTFDDYESVVRLTSRFYTNGRIKKVILPNSDGRLFNGDIPFQTCIGVERYKPLFIFEGVEEEDILVTPMTAYHTKAETNAFIELSKESNFRTGIITANPHQLLREMLGWVKAMKEADYWMSIYAVVPPSNIWQEEVSGSQGIGRMTREKNIADEFSRIILYQERGDLASFDELFDYMKRRELGFLSQ